MPSSIPDQVYRTFLDFQEVAEKKRTWSVMDDIPWHKLDASQASADTVQRIEIYCSEELYVPDYGSQGLAMMRSMFGMAWFLSRWTFEESKHGLAFREYLTRSRLHTPENFARLEAGVVRPDLATSFRHAPSDVLLQRAAGKRDLSGL